jgi:hypothetical protein
VVDLHADVVPVELARHLPALRREQVGERIAERRLARMAQMQRPGRIRRHELDHHLLAGVRARGAEALPLAKYLSHHLLLGRRRDPQVDEAGPGDLHFVDQPVRGRVDAQRIGDGRRHFARIALQALGDLQRHVAGQVAVRLDLRPLQPHRHTGGAEPGKRLLDQRDHAVLLFGKHRWDQGKGRSLAAGPGPRQGLCHPRAPVQSPRGVTSLSPCCPRPQAAGV